MGVFGLWNFIEASGEPVHPDTLENKVLAIDICTLLHKIIAEFTDRKGNRLPNAHLLGLFYRLCTLVQCRIKPVVVFGGGFPQIKTETISKRGIFRNRLVSECVQHPILQAEEKVVEQALSQNASEILKSQATSTKANSRRDKDDIPSAILPQLKDDYCNIIENYEIIEIPDDDVNEDNSTQQLKTAAQTLGENKPCEQVKDIAKERRELDLECNSQGRMGTITEKMCYECMHLLRLFGIPYIFAPMDPEAQSAFLDANNLIDGIITDDSDIWLFGGRTVFRNFFNKRKHVTEFKMENIEKLYNMDRSNLIQLAMLVGSDYTTGIPSMDTITGLEVVATFSDTPIQEGGTTEMMSVLSSLLKFRKWWVAEEHIKPISDPSLRGKLKNIKLIEDFPNSNIVEAYLNPQVDKSGNKLSWGTPDFPAIRKFTKSTFGWTEAKTDDVINEIKKEVSIVMEISDKKRLKRQRKMASSVKELKVSTRVRNAINKMGDNKLKKNKPHVKRQRKHKRKMVTGTVADSAGSVKVTDITNEQGSENPTYVEKNVHKSVKSKKRRRKRTAKMMTDGGNDNKNSTESGIAAKISKIQ